MSVCLGGVAFAQEDFKTQKFHFNKERQPTQILEVLTTPEAKTAISAVAAYFGVPPEITGVITAIPQIQDRTSEEGDIVIPLDDGYKFCDLRYSKWQSTS